MARQEHRVVGARDLALKQRFEVHEVVAHDCNHLLRAKRIVAVDRALAHDHHRHVARGLGLERGLERGGELIDVDRPLRMVTAFVESLEERRDQRVVRRELGSDERER